MLSILLAIWASMWVDVSAAYDMTVTDVTFASQKPGGAALLRKFAVKFPQDKSTTSDDTCKEATWAFEGGYNQHTRAARKQMRELIVARLSSSFI